jgi:hypothetical protein
MVGLDSNIIVWMHYVSSSYPLSDDALFKFIKFLGEKL